MLALVVLLACVAAASLLALVLGRGRTRLQQEQAAARRGRLEAEVEVLDTAIRGLARGSHPAALLGTLTGLIARAVGAERVRLLEEAPATGAAERVGDAGWLAADGGDPQSLAAVAGRLDALLRLVEARRALFAAQVESEALRRSDELKTALLRAL